MLITQRFLTMLLSTIIMLSSMTSAFASEFVAGEDYQELEVQDKIDGHHIIVREFFWYGCPHCYNLEPYIQAWEKTRPADVVFLRTPAPFNPIWEANARGYYAAKAMGIADHTHTALLHAIHEKNQKLHSKDSLADFYADFGADKQAFKKLYHSKQVDKQIKAASEAALRYKLTGVPAIIVHGRYVVKGSPQTFDVVNYLIQKIKSEKHEK